MKRFFFAIFMGVVALSLFVLGIGIYKYQSISGLTRRVQLEIASRRPKEVVVMPTFVPQATVDSVAFIADLAIETPVIVQSPTLLPTPTEAVVQVDVTEIAVETTMEPTIRSTVRPSTTPTVIPTPIYLPARTFVNLTGYRHNWQTWNNCGPATLATYLSFLNKSASQEETAAALKPNENDKNVRVDEIVSYVEKRFPDLVVTPLINGSPETLRLLLSNNFPVMLQTWLEEDPNDGMGHFRFLVGYDEANGEWIVSDSYISTNVTSPYAGIRIKDEEFVNDWSVFSNRYILIYRPEYSELIGAIIGEDLDTRANGANALRTYSDRLQTEPDNPFIWHTMGDLLLADGRPAQAAQAYDQARGIGLPWRMFWYNFGIFEAYMAVERYEDVVVLADAVIGSGGAGEEVYFWKGVAHRALGNEASAAAAFRQALWWNPTHQASKTVLNEP